MRHPAGYTLDHSKYVHSNFLDLGKNACGHFMFSVPCSHLMFDLHHNGIVQVVRIRGQLFICLGLEE